MRLGTRELIFVMLLLALPVLAWWFYFSPRKKDMAAISARIASRQRELSMLDRAGPHLKHLHAEIKKLNAAIAFFERKLPDRVEMARMLQRIYKNERHNNLNIVSQHYLKTKKSAGFTEQPIEMSLRGGFRGFYQFLRALEHMPRVTRIDTLAIRRSAANNKLIDANFTLSVFFANDHR